jgi:hypothetical protein
VGRHGEVAGFVEACLLDCKPLPFDLLREMYTALRNPADPVCALGRAQRVYYERIGEQPPPL